MAEPVGKCRPDLLSLYADNELEEEEHSLLALHLNECPACKKETIYSEANPYRPFCSERCKLIDLGAWLDGDYFIPAKDDESDHSVAEEDS